MSDHLDTLVAQGVYRARLIENCLHEDGPWLLRWAGMLRLATRTVENEGIVFKAIFVIPEEPESIVALKLRDEEVAVRTIPALLDLKRMTDSDVVELSLRVGFIQVEQQYNIISE